MFLIEEKEEIARNRIIKAFDGSDIQVLNGRYGPYISDGKLNGRIPEGSRAGLADAGGSVKLMEETGKPMRGRFGKKARRAGEEGRRSTKDAAAKKAPAKKAAKKAAKKTREESRAKKATKKAAKKASPKKAASTTDLTAR